MFGLQNLSHSIGIHKGSKWLRSARTGFCGIVFVIALLITACNEGSFSTSSAAEPVVEPTDTTAPVDSPPPKVEASPTEPILSEEVLANIDDKGIAIGPTITPEVDKEIVVCLGGTLSTLFPYGDNANKTLGIQHLLYESLYTSVSYDYQAVGLEKIPSIEDGDAIITSILVEEGDLVRDVDGNVVRLLENVTVLDAEGNEISFDGTPVEMVQMVVDFSFRPMVWSDGTPVTAQDSVYSYNLNLDPKITANKSRQANSERYEALGERSVRWVGLPGYMDQTYFLNVWSPLPSHQLAGKTAAELMTAEETTKMPLSSGPYVVTDWSADGDLVLSRNAHYYRQDEGFPIIDRIIVKFGDGEVFLAGDSSVGCDVIADGAMHAGNLPLLEAAAETEEWEILTSSGTVFEQIAFGINPAEEYAGRRPDWFEDRRVRQAMTMCTDRQRMVDELTDGRAELLDAYLPAGHKLYPDDLTTWTYDPQQANILLNEAGYLDFAEDGRRQDVITGVPMTITLGTNSESPLRLQITEIFQENMADCGIPVEIQNFPAGTWFAEGPVGRVFGRRFDLAEFAWLGKPLPDCGLYVTENIPGPEESGFGGWQDTNVTGWSNEEYDAACLAALDVLPGGDGYDDFQQEALRIFARELPAIPLFTNVKVAAARPWLKKVKLDPSQSSLLWNIFEWDIDQ